MTNKRLRQVFAITLGLIASFATTANDTDPYIYILGVAQDAGYPQTGCYETHCMPGWQDASLRRSAVSLGLIDPAGHKKYLFDATPGFPSQLYELEMEAPSGSLNWQEFFSRMRILAITRD